MNNPTHPSGIPWQFRWKRPRLAKSIATSNRERLRGMTTVECKSARLAATEVASILESVRGCLSNNDGPTKRASSSHFEEAMKWEDLESSSDEEDKNEENEAINHEHNEDYVLTVTILASATSVKLYESIRNEVSSLNLDTNYDLFLAADTVYLEVVKDSSYIIDTHGNDSDIMNSYDEVDIVTSKLLQWPTSALVNISNWSDDGTTARENFIHTQLNKTNQFIREILKIPGPQHEAARSRHQTDQLARKTSLLRNRVGLTSVAFCRRDTEIQNKMVNDQVDYDELYDLLNNMSFGIPFNAQHTLPSNEAISKKSRDASTSENYTSSAELLLTCLTNDGKLHIFSAINLLLDREDPHSQEKANFFHIKKEKDKDDILIKDFETFLFGAALQKKLKEGILPLSHPKATIDISIVQSPSTFNIREGIKPVPTYEHNKSTENDRDEKQQHRLTARVLTSSSNMQTSAERTESSNITLNFENNSKVPVAQTSQQLFDLSFLDSNVELSTIHNRTISNIAMSCTTAHEYIVISGKGIRTKRSVTKPKPESEDIQWETSYSEGGFTCFISLKYLSEAKIIFFPFAPTQITPVMWNNMHLVLVMGKRSDHCIAIRTDSSSLVCLRQNEFLEPFSGLEDRSFFFDGSNKRLIRKFSSLKLSFLSDENTNFQSADRKMPVACPLSVTSMTSVSPSIGIVLLSFDGSSIFLSLHTFLGLNKDILDLKSQGYLLCTKEDRHFVKIPLPLHLEKTKSSIFPLSKESPLWCISGKGWSLLGIDSERYLDLFYISWEGSKDGNGSFFKHLKAENKFGTSMVSNILPIILTNPKSALPSLNSSQFQNSPIDSGTQRDCDTVIIDVIEQIRRERNNRKEGKSHVTNISKILLRRCSSWNRINDFTKTRSLIYDQISVAMIRYSGINHFLTLRKRVVNSDETHFQEVLSWLCKLKDYYTGASVALNLLNDTIALQDLRGFSASSSSEGFIYRSSKELLDGIISLSSSRTSSNSIAEEAANSVTLTSGQWDQSTLCELADMAIVCLVKGGLVMSHALDGFLGRNPSYDSSRACLILVANVLIAISNLDVKDNLAAFSFNPLTSDTHALWPIQCLLRVAVSRNCMPKALLLLNMTIPNELRNRSYRASQQTSLPLCQSIVSMILASSEASAGILLNLVDEEIYTYWASLTQRTRFTISLLHIRGKYPFLREAEVREWALSLLHRETDLLTSGNSNAETQLPSWWLQGLCLGCISNSGCDFTQLKVNNSYDDEKSLRPLQNEEFIHTSILFEENRMGGIDFDIFISSLLLLQQRGVQWNADAIVSTQSILNTVCKLAGRQAANSIFAFDCVLVIKQCARIGNVNAVANLIGGHDGLVLQCANIIASGDTSRIGEAEGFLIGKTENFIPSYHDSDLSTNIDTFTPTEGHRYLLWNLEKYVLSSKKYNEFLISYRGNIDPVFAARICLRAWIAMSVAHPYCNSGKWLENWLSKALRKDNKEQSRLASATLSRCLLCNEMGQKEIETNNNISELLGFSGHFLVMLAQVSCGIAVSYFN